MITEQPVRVVLRTLTTAGWSFKRNGKGSHEVWECPTGKHPVTVSTGHGAVSAGVVRTVNKAIAGCSCEQEE
ncbi:type II toxin-antitoxin system HicA family toxin [Nocardia sp. NBC_00565]|uniref:type II toxin-antitoxin system HicA family toxin n=1 Tax=Nocardia sp. NBC_00565 TaxID=2975993 RepID=UPI002E81BF5A|nr:type II toxin-antitoxin system HicA family toxin [Nocardia sp. NBC_00565]WUC03722.1 type II toxin-antitoxin system HicA family toxin [Nocardia sp. NBC_00565]